MLKKTWCVSALLALLAVSPAVGQAQVRVEIAPLGGLFLPVTDIVEFNQELLTFIEEEVEFLLDLSPGSLDLDEVSAKHKAAALFGGRITGWLTDVVALEGSFVFALSDGELKVVGSALGESFDESVDDDANVWLGSLKVLYRFVPQPDAIWAIHIGGGPAIIGRGGDVWEDTDGTTDFGGVLNVGAIFDVSPQVGIRLDVEDYIYSAKFEVEGEELGDSKFQNDLLFTGGIVIRFAQ